MVTEGPGPERGPSQASASSPASSGDDRCSTDPLEGLSHRTADSGIEATAPDLYRLILFVGGVLIAVSFLWALGSNDPTAWIHAGAESPLRPIIEDQLGTVRLYDGDGHDGQDAFVVALDLDGRNYGDLAADGPIRWRRVLYPFVASFGGLVDGRPLLFSFAIVAALCFGLVLVCFDEVRRVAGARQWTLAAVFLNPGLYLSLLLLTPDLLAVALGLAGVVAWLRGRAVIAILALSLAVLAKEQYLLIAAGIAYLAWVRGERSMGVRLIAVPFVVGAAWAGYVAVTLGSATDTNNAFALPFVGLWEALENLDSTGSLDRRLLVLSLIALVLSAAAVSACSSRFVRQGAVPWLALTPFLSVDVWMFGNNPVRVLIPLWLWAVLAIDHVVQARTEVKSLSGHGRDVGL